MNHIEDQVTQFLTGVTIGYLSQLLQLWETEVRSCFVVIFSFTPMQLSLITILEKGEVSG